MHPKWHGHQGSDSTLLLAYQVVSSLTCPHKPNGSLHICLNPWDLNKTIVQAHYKAPTLEEISHHLNSATCFSKLDTKDSFWSIHLNDQSSYLTTINTHHSRYWFLCMPFSLKMCQDIFQMHMDQVTDHLWYYCYRWCYMHLWPHSWGAWLAPLEAHSDNSPAWCCLQQLKVPDQATTVHLLWCCVHG